VAVSAHKKVLVSRFDREPVEGFMQSPETQQDSLEVLRADGSLLKVPIAETKAICFVRDFDGGETWKKHRQFSARPKMGGLWVRLKFRDGDSLEGIVPNNLMHLEPTGFGVVPPDPTFQNQRIWVPRPALAGVEVLGVIGSPLRRRKPGEKPDEGQLRMFE
jgi:hypothetical protein